MNIRLAGPDDADTILALLHELAAFEAGTVTATAADLAQALRAGQLEALLAFDGDQAIGLLSLLPSYSSWRGQAGAVIHDLYVRPAARRLGSGKALVQAAFALARHRHWHRLDVNVLDWNQAAQHFYASLGLAPLAEWRIWRIEGEALEIPPRVQ